MTNPLWSDDPDSLALKRIQRDLKKNSNAALSELRRLAEAGSVKAAIFLAKVCQSGEAGSIDIEESERWLRRAASSGEGAALYHFGKFHFERRQFARAFHEFEAAARTKYAPAYRMLGVMYRTGITVEKDTGRSLDLFEKAAKGGDLYGRIYFAQCLIHGASGYSFGNIRRPMQQLKGVWLICTAIRDIILSHGPIE